MSPEMWAKLVYRVAGANTGALYGNERGNVLGNGAVECPPGHTFETYCKFLLRTLPPKTSEHYKNKIAVYLNWWRTRGYPDEIPQFVDGTLETAGKVPSWRKICKSILRNDYWCRWLGFSPTKTQAYERYMALMKKRRQNWQIFPETTRPTEVGLEVSAGEA